MPSAGTRSTTRASRYPLPGRASSYSGRKIPARCCPASGSWRSGRSTASSTTRSTTTSPKASNLPPLEERIDTFRACAERLGRDRVIWRFDPLLLTDRLDVGELLHRIGRLGDRLSGYTSKLVFSFADIRNYRRVAANLDRAAVRWREFSPAEAGEFAAGVRELNRRWGLDLATCGEAADLSRYGIAHNRCIDDSLLVRLFPGDRALMEHLGAAPGTLFGPAAEPPHRKDPGQRPACGCCPSRDIGGYGTCPHGCLYCYANPSPEQGRAAYLRLVGNPDSESLG